MLDFDDNYRLRGTLDAKQGEFVKDGAWKLDSTEQFDILQNGNATLVQHDKQPLALALQPKYVHMVTIDPEDLSPSQLVSFMSYMNEYSQVPKTYQLAFWQKVGSPFALIALVVIACSFIFGPLRQQSMGFRLVIALFAGLLLLPAGFSRLCQSGLCAITGMVRIYSYFADVCYWRLLAPSSPLSHRKIEEINRNKRLKPSTGHGLFCKIR